jgi:UDP-GlcNAc:undecaprenyl-phosphate GlcNAc-1-phosphate transferase
MEYSLILTVLLSFILTFVTIPSIVNVSNAKNLFDEPNRRKLNKVVVPTMGGIAIFVGSILSAMLFLDKSSPYEFRYILIAVIMMLFIGIKDDILIIAPSKKLMVQFAAALILVLPGKFRIIHTYDLFSATLLNEWISIPLSVLVILFLVNALNLIDGIDGLAGALTLFASLALGSWFMLTGHYNSAIICLAFCGSLVAFLFYNLRGGKNKIFMGDTGSLILGVFLAAMIIRFNELNYAVSSPFRFSQAPLVALALMIVPVTDTLRVFFIRIKNKRSPFSPDMNHFHHLLIKSGLSHVQATGFMLGYTILFATLALTFSHFNLDLSLTFPLLPALSFSMVGLIWYRTKQRTSRAIPNENNRMQVKTIDLHIRRSRPVFNHGKLYMETGTQPLSAHEANMVKIPGLTDHRKHTRVVSAE